MKKVTHYGLAILSFATGCLYAYLYFGNKFPIVANDPAGDILKKYLFFLLFGIGTCSPIYLHHDAAVHAWIAKKMQRLFC